MSTEDDAHFVPFNEMTRAASLAILDQYEASVKELVGILREHRSRGCMYWPDTEACPSISLILKIDEMPVDAVRRALVMAVIMLLRE